MPGTVVLGVLLVLAGFITALPSGSAAGSIAHRHLGLGTQGGTARLATKSA